MNDEYNGYITEAPVNHLCLCSGYDGVGRGLRNLFPNLRTIAFVEREGFPIANLVAKAEENEMDAAPVFTDVKQFPYNKFRGCVDILSAGFPCQPFSSAGKRQSTDDPRHLYPWIANGITACRPRVVLLENVEGIITAKTGDGEPVLKYVLRDLEERGYRTSWCVASANEVGAPHQRKRVFVMGYATSERLRRGSEDESRQQSEVLGSRPQSDEELANSTRTGKHRELRDVEQAEGRSNEHDCNGQTRRGSKAAKFPARPNERQYEWEEPRTLEDPKNGKPKLISMQGGSERAERGEHSVGSGFASDDTRSEGDEREIKCELGGATHGRTCRVDPVANRTDRLRLLGNGVVPATCERAVRILWSELYGSARA